MATTRIIPMHIGKGRTIAQMLTDGTDYGKNPEKTNQGELISSYACDPCTADAEFLLAKREYDLHPLCCRPRHPTPWSFCHRMHRGICPCRLA